MFNRALTGKTLPSVSAPGAARALGATWSASISTGCAFSSLMTMRTCGASCARCCMASARARCTRPKTVPAAWKPSRITCPDIVITDWVMPIFDGLELTQMIRQPGANANPLRADHHAHRLFREEARRRRPRRRDHRIPRQADLGEGALRTHSQPRRQSAPFIKTKTFFGPDRRRNVNPNYVGPERRKGGKADVIRQQPLLDKVLG